MTNSNLRELTNNFHSIKDRLYTESLSDVEFTRYKCDPQTLSFMSDISFQIRTLYPEINFNVKDVLDVGARTAIGSWFLQTLHHPESFSAIKMKVTAIDIQDDYKKYANIFFPDIDYQVGDIFDLPNNSRDIVICSHTIEHVPSPKAFVDQLAKIAREYVIIACPFEEPENNLIPGHVNSIDQAFINQFDCVLQENYTNMHWHQSQACIFAIKAYS